MAEELRTEDFNYHLPEELIASKPSEKRDGSRMMLIDRKTGSISCHLFEEFKDIINDGDLCIFNNTKVVKSRFFSDDNKIEITRLDAIEPKVWKCLVKPGKKMRIGYSIEIDGIKGIVESILPEGERIIRFDEEIDIESNGQLALPHYMRREAELLINISELKQQVLDLTMKNAELKDMVLDNGGDYTETDGLEVGSPSDYEEDKQLNLFND